MTLPYTVPAATKVPGSPNFVPDIDAAYNAISAIGGVSVCDSQWAGGADPTGATDSTAAIQAALAGRWAQGGGDVTVPWGQFMVSGIYMPPYTRLVSLTPPITLNQFTGSTGIARIFANPAWAPGASVGIVNFQSKTPGGWSVNAAGSGLKNVFLDGSGNASANIQGIVFNGPVYDTDLEDVFIWKPGHNGFGFTGVTESGIGPTFAYHQRWRRVSVVSAANVGFPLANLTDSDLEIFAFGSASDNVTLQNNSNSVMRIRSEWSSGGRGVSVTGAGGSVVIDLSTDQNAKEGLYIHAATAQATQGGGLVIRGKLHADGNGGGGDNIGVKITGSSVPIDLTGLNIESGQNVNDSLWYPATAFSVDTSSNVSVSGGTFQGITTVWNDGGTNANITRTGVIGATGNPGSQVFTPLPDLGVSVTPWLPADFGLLAWSADAELCASGSTLTLNTVTLHRVNLRYAAKVANVLAWITAGGSGQTAAQNFGGLYNSAGTKIAATADQTTPWTGTGLMTMALSGGPYNLDAGYYWVALLTNGGTSPTFLRIPTPNSSAVPNMGNAAAAFRSATNGTGTTLPSSITPASNAAAGQVWWVALS